MPHFIEIHIIQNIAPGNLNRDDTGAPKDAIFGGFRRARLSSQAQKRPVRQFFRESGLIAPPHLGLRTKKVLARLSEMLLTLGRAAPDNAIRQALAAIGMKLDDQGEAQYLLFLAEDELARFAELIDRHWDALNVEADGKKSKKDAKSALPKEVIAEANRILDGGRAADIALFGRMLADLPGANQDAACQVAHSISTHAVERQFDYFTAVDDLATPDETGAAMIDNVEFNSATHYRYAALDPLKLLANLHGDEELARRACTPSSRRLRAPCPLASKTASPPTTHRPSSAWCCAKRCRSTSPTPSSSRFFRSATGRSRPCRFHVWRKRKNLGRSLW